MSASLSREAVGHAEAFAAGLDPEDFSMGAVNARATVLSHRDWIRANYRREKLRRAWDEFFEEWDILICPQMATPAFPHDHRSFDERTINVDGVAQSYFKQLFWAGIVINAYLPSTVFPTGPSRDGLPIGLQAVSAPYRDHRTIEFASQIAREIGGFVPPPNYE
jgi:amidase